MLLIVELVNEIHCHCSYMFLPIVIVSIAMNGIIVEGNTNLNGDNEVSMIVYGIHTAIIYIFFRHLTEDMISKTPNISATNNAET